MNRPLTWMVAVTLAATACAFEGVPDGSGIKGKRRSGTVVPAVVEAPLGAAVSLPPPPPAGFTPQIRLGYTVGDQWEPAVAADRVGHVYVLAPQYLGVPGCPTCPSPTMILQVSSDGGQTFSAPRQIAAPGTGQWDAQIVVDPVDGQTVYASWLQNGKSDTVVAKSTDYGQTWNVVVADSTNAGTDKPILAVRGTDVYVVFNHAQKIWAATSHDGGQTFTQTQINKNGNLGWALAAGGVVTPNGHVHFGWAGYERNGGATGDVNLFISSSSDGGATWVNHVIDVSGAPPDCAAYLCGWAYLGAQVTITADAAGTLFALWNSSPAGSGGAPNRMYFAKSTNHGATWTPRAEVSTAPAGVAHAFPAIVAGAAGDVRVGWMDARHTGQLWNVYYRTSSNGGTSWSIESDLSTFTPGLPYLQANGFAYPFGDYWELDIDGNGQTHAIFGEGANYDSPGSIWYARGQ